MVRPSNAIVGFLNMLTALVGLAAVTVSLVFQLNGASSATPCQKLLQSPLLGVGIALFVVSAIGFAGSCWGRRNRSLMCIYMSLMLLFALGLAVFTVFAFMVTNRGAGRVVSGRGYKEYRLGDYSHWLQRHVVSGKRWVEIRSCLADGKVCGRLEKKGVGMEAAQFFKLDLSPIESGCCKPPSDCRFEFKNVTYWTEPASGAPTESNSDCSAWSNDPSRLCYSCNSCKAGFLANIRQQWRHLLVFNICMILVVVLIFTLASCAAENNRVDSYKGGSKHRGYP